MKNYIKPGFEYIQLTPEETFACGSNHGSGGSIGIVIRQPAHPIITPDDFWDLISKFFKKHHW